MTNLIILTALLGVPFAVVTALQHRAGTSPTSAALRYRIGASLLFGFTGMGHFFQNAAMAEMLPSIVPYRAEIIYATGGLELLGAIGLWVPQVRRLTGLLFIVMLLGVLPTNVYAAFNHVNFGGHQLGPTYLLLRVPFQFVLMVWVYNAAVAITALPKPVLGTTRPALGLDSQVA